VLEDVSVVHYVAVTVTALKFIGNARVVVVLRDVRVMTVMRVVENAVVVLNNLQSCRTGNCYVGCRVYY
jgi:hypothetical protein